MTAILVVVVSTSGLTRGGIQQIISKSEGRIEIAAMFAESVRNQHFFERPQRACSRHR